MKLFDDCKWRETYIGQFELIAAITPFVSLPREWFVGRPVELWIDKYSGAIGALLNGYSGVPDCARIVNMFHFAVAKAGCASWIDYVPSESNPADVPSRLIHEMTVNARGAPSGIDLFRNQGGAHALPAFADASGAWLSPTAIAASVW